MLIEQDRKECMFTWTIDHSQNDGKQQEWEEMAESWFVQLQLRQQDMSFMSVGLVWWLCHLNVSSNKIYFILIIEFEMSILA